MKSFCTVLKVWRAFRNIGYNPQTIETLPGGNMWVLTTAGSPVLDRLGA